MTYVLLGVTVVISVVIAMGLYTCITWKLMMSPKVWQKLYEQTYKSMAAMDYDSLMYNVDDEDDKEA